MPVLPARRRLPWVLAVAALAATTGIPVAHAVSPAPVPSDPANVAPMIDEMPQALVGQRNAQGMPVPRPARRDLSARVVAQSVPAGPLGRRDLGRAVVVGDCGHRRYVTTPKGEAVLADFGGGQRIDDVTAVRTLRAVGFEWAIMPTALATMAAESDRCPRARHNNLDARGRVASVDYGLWQINTTWHPRYASWKLFDPMTNTRAAKELYDQSGFTPWHGYEHREAYMGWAQKAIDAAKAVGVK